MFLAKFLKKFLNMCLKKWSLKIAVSFLIIAITSLVIGCATTVMLAKSNEAPNQDIDNISSVDAKTAQNSQHPKFSLIGEPYLNPKIVEELLAGAIDPNNSTITIDLLAGNKSNRFELDVEFRNIDDQTYVGYSRATGYGTFFYRYVGTSPSGVHILLCADHGGGSGVFMNILLLSLKVDNVIEGSSEQTITRERALLHSMGAISLGDRYLGDITYTNGVLRIGEDISFMKHGQRTTSQRLEIK